MADRRVVLPALSRPRRRMEYSFNGRLVNTNDSRGEIEGGQYPLY